MKRARYLQSLHSVPTSDLAVAFLRALDRIRVLVFAVVEHLASIAAARAERLHEQAYQLKTVNWDRWVKTHSVGGAAALL
eukprot:2339458-Pyramimonas_sp.AAC.1